MRLTEHMMRSEWPLTAVFLFAFVSTADAKDPEEAAGPLFESQDILDVRIVAPIDVIARLLDYVDRNKTAYQRI